MGFLTIHRKRSHFPSHRNPPQASARKSEIFQRWARRCLAFDDHSASTSSPAKRSVMTSSMADRNQSWPVPPVPPVSESPVEASFRAVTVAFSDAFVAPTPARRLATRVAYGWPDCHAVRGSISLATREAIKECHWLRKEFHIPGDRFDGCELNCAILSRGVGCRA